MVQLSRDLDCQYKTAFVLTHNLREAMAQEVQTGEVLEGHVEIDGAYFGGHIRPANAKIDRVEGRFKRHQTGCWFLYLPPYSPDLNPIELAFSNLESHLRRISARSFTSVLEALGDICAMYSPQECSNYLQATDYASG